MRLWQPRQTKRTAGEGKREGGGDVHEPKKRSGPMLRATPLGKERGCLRGELDLDDAFFNTDVLDSA